MLAALEMGVKGNKWFSLIDKVARLDVHELAWEKVRSNAGGCGVDGVSVECFRKDSQRRLLAVKEQIESGTYYRPSGGDGLLKNMGMFAGRVGVPPAMPGILPGILMQGMGDGFGETPKPAGETPTLPGR